MLATDRDSLEECSAYLAKARESMRDDCPDAAITWTLKALESLVVVVDHEQTYRRVLTGRVNGIHCHD